MLAVLIDCNDVGNFEYLEECRNITQPASLEAATKSL